MYKNTLNVNYSLPFFRCLILHICFISCICSNIAGQDIIGLGTRYNDSFREWEIQTTDEDVVGELRMRWTFQDNWTEWDVRIGDVVATIQQKWKDDPNLWEIRCDGIVVNAKTTWPGEFNRWKLNDGQHQFNWGTRYVNIRDHWSTDSRAENFKVDAYYEGDPRDWVVTDELPDDVSMAMKIAMIFLSVHFSSPRI